ncbi:hypothetical protein [Aureispira sp. CCB-E]|uniref:hypothetical protein n=1 Tax=Aureispira sp. CCB-E TaxID=3051121 RepID=UPI002869346F|nr:hypothetical protein [Aureispira sp. CCB-E]WMX17491.1 hypothetical protein QP953_14005 [Aureispira sp. CCB-E]
MNINKLYQLTIALGPHVTDFAQTINSAYQYVNKNNISYINYLNQAISVIKLIIENNFDEEYPLLYSGLGLDKVFNDDIIATIENIIRIENNFNLAKTEIMSLRQDYSKSINHLNQLANGLKPLAHLFTPHSKSVNSCISLHFKEGVNILTLEDLKTHSSKWEQTLNSFTRLANSTNNDYTIEGIQKGSLLITLGVVTSTLFATLKGINLVLDAVKKIYEIKNLKHSLESINTSNDEALNQANKIFEEKIKSSIEYESERISLELIKEYNDEKQDKQEVQNAIKIGLKDIMKFTLKGGSIDVSLKQSATSETSEHSKILTEMSKELKQHNKTIEEIRIEMHKKNIDHNLDYLDAP